MITTFVLRTDYGGFASNYVNYEKLELWADAIDIMSADQIQTLQNGGTVYFPQVCEYRAISDQNLDVFAQEAADARKRELQKMLDKAKARQATP